MDYIEVPEKDKFLFYKSFYIATNRIQDPASYMRIMKAILDYEFLGKEPELTEVVECVTFDLIKPQLDANERKRIQGYRGKKDGAKGGRPKKNTTGDIEEDTTGDKEENPTGVIDGIPMKNTILERNEGYLTETPLGLLMESPNSKEVIDNRKELKVNSEEVIATTGRGYKGETNFTETEQEYGGIATVVDYFNQMYADHSKISSSSVSKEICEQVNKLIASGKSMNDFIFLFADVKKYMKSSGDMMTDFEYMINNFDGFRKELDRMSKERRY